MRCDAMLQIKQKTRISTSKSKSINQILEPYLFIIYQMIKRNQLLLIASTIQSIETILQQKNGEEDKQFLQSKKITYKL